MYRDPLAGPIATMAKHLQKNVVFRHNHRTLEISQVVRLLTVYGISDEPIPCRSLAHGRSLSHIRRKFRFYCCLGGANAFQSMLTNVLFSYTCSVAEDDRRFGSHRSE